jgi:SagB-type dehydrogenase family enzyme
MPKTRKRTSRIGSPESIAATIRVATHGVRISRDNGTSADLPPSEAKIARQLVARLRDWSFIGVTAGTLAVLGEANSISPRTDLWAEPLDLSLRHVIPATRVDSPLGQLLSRRLSQRSMFPCDADEIDQMLATSYRALAVDVGPDGYPISHRPVPSAGARHPFDLIVACNQVRGKTRGYFRFNSFTSSLTPITWPVPLDVSIGAVRQAGNLIQDPAAVVFLVCDLQKTISRYPSGVLLALLDAGALAFCLHIAAVELGLASCIVGTSGVLCGATPSEPTQDVVAVAVGSR